jgi:large subunit ribosomal protein L1
MPNGTGKTKRVAVFAQGAKAEEAKAAVPTSSAWTTSLPASRPATCRSTW